MSSRRGSRQKPYTQLGSRELFKLLKRKRTFYWIFQFKKNHKFTRSNYCFWKHRNLCKQVQYHLLLTFYYTSLFYDLQVDLLAIELNMPKSYVTHPQNIDRNGIQHMVYLCITKHSTRESFEIIIIITITSCVQHHNTSPFKKTHKLLLYCIQRDTQCRLRSWQPVKMPSRKLLTAGDDSCFNSWADRINLNALKSKVDNTCLVF